ncbi:MAG: sugar ABC transporter permease [Clostridiales bacterium]|nr:sugar ABC transporter permease [Clostridiales bacterium]MBR6488641.1 sugar ABC transporter permease [Clostridiales bacterium]
MARNSINSLSSADLQPKKVNKWAEARRQPFLLISSALLLIYGIIFYYVPVLGWITAFQDYKPAKGFLKSQWVGFAKFQKLFENKTFFLAFRNTLAMGVINLVFHFVTAIAFALILNEVRVMFAKKFVQTISYMPHFLSWIIVTAIVRDILASDGIVNEFLMNVCGNDKAIDFFAVKGYFWWIVAAANVWKETGWNAIIYLAAITAIDPSLYEAADMDGASRFQKVWYITLPSLRPTIMILLLINIGNVLNAGFELQYILGNDVISDVSKILDVFILDWGISQFDFSLGTAAGIFKSVIALILVCLGNWTAKRTGDERLF